MAMDRDKVAGSGGDRDESPVSFTLDVRSGVPTYLQIVQQVEAALRLGHLQSGDRLPKVKDVVSSLGINPNTVLKAYRELENRGITVGRPGVGTFVIAAPLAVSTETFLELRSLLLDGWLQVATERGLQSDEIAALFHSALSEIEDPTSHLSSAERGRSR
jgi:GntR family transcriptional regulator